MKKLKFSSYLLIGSGRVAKHFAAYFQLLEIPYKSWNRNQSDAELNLYKHECSHAVVAIRDSAISEFIETKLSDFQGLLVHCSGSLQVPRAISAHPLMSFGPELYGLSDYQNIPFVIAGELPLSEVMPRLPNKSYNLKCEHQALYHALCVIAGNFPTILWSGVQEEFNKIGLPPTVLFPYLERVLVNFEKLGPLSLTGPHSRQDTETIQRNMESLVSSPLVEIYSAFTEVFLRQQNQYTDRPLLKREEMRNAHEDF